MWWSCPRWPSPLLPRPQAPPARGLPAAGRRRRRTCSGSSTWVRQWLKHPPLAVVAACRVGRAARMSSKRFAATGATRSPVVRAACAAHVGGQPPARLVHHEPSAGPGGVMSRQLRAQVAPDVRQEEQQHSEEEGVAAWPSQRARQRSASVGEGQQVVGQHPRRFLRHCANRARVRDQIRQETRRTRARGFAQ